ncbi:MAG: peptidoglycan-binding domain-containing protein [Candidatus Paceibacterota bacterium]
MSNKILNTKIKKISTVIIILFLAFGFFKKINALTIADIELLISIGIIPVGSAESARDFVNSQNTSGTGSIIKTDATSPNECLILNQNLVKGNNGTAVSALQRFLKSEGHFPADQSITGYFGDLTVQAVSDFQLATGLISSSKSIGAGTMGPISRKKVQEVSCKKATEVPVVEEVAVEDPVVVATTTAAIKTSFIKTKDPEVSKTTVVSVTSYARESNTDDAQFDFRYDIKIEPRDEIEVFEIVVICDPTAVTLDARDVKKCGDFVDYKSTTRGTKALNIKYKNISVVQQPIIFAVTALDEDERNLGSAEVRDILTSAVPRPSVNPNTGESIFSESSLPESRNCNRQEQLEYIRNRMSPYNPLVPVHLPSCYPGNLVCNRAYPPTYCQITDGPSSDDLCASGMQFLNGQCIVKN